MASQGTLATASLKAPASATAPVSDKVVNPIKESPAVVSGNITPTQAVDVSGRTENINQEVAPQNEKFITRQQMFQIKQRADERGDDIGQVILSLQSEGFEIEGMQDYQNSKVTSELQNVVSDQGNLQKRPPLPEGINQMPGFLQKAVKSLYEAEGPGFGSVVSRGIGNTIVGLVGGVEQIDRGFEGLSRRGEPVNDQAVRNDIIDYRTKEALGFGNDFTIREAIDEVGIEKFREVAQQFVDNIEEDPMYKELSGRLQKEQDEIDNRTVSENVLDLLEGGTTSAVTFFAPHITAGINTVAETETGRSVLGGIAGTLQLGGEIVNNIPGLSNFRESLPVERQEEFDQFVGNLGLSTILGAKFRNQKTGKIDAKTIGKSIGKSVIEDFTGLKLKKTPTKKSMQEVSKLINERDKLVGRVIQGQEADIGKATRALNDIDLVGVKNYSDLIGRIESKQKDIVNSVDNYLSDGDASVSRISIDDLSDTRKVGETNIDINYVNKAFDDLTELYTKENDVNNLIRLEEFKQRAQRDGMTVKEINDLAREYGVKESGFSDRTGNPLTSSTAKGRENVRSGLKRIARDKGKELGLKDTSDLDLLYSNMARTRKLIESIQEKAFKMRQKYNDRTQFQVLLNAGYDIADLISLGTLNNTVSLLRQKIRGGDLKNYAQIEDALGKNLKRIDEIDKQISGQTTPATILNTVSDYIKDSGKSALIKAGILTDDEE